MMDGVKLLFGVECFLDLRDAFFSLVGLVLPESI